MIVLNKVDVLRLEELSPEKRGMLKPFEDDADVPLMEMSTITDFGVMDVKTQACDRLLAHRVEMKMRTKKVKSCCWYEFRFWFFFFNEASIFDNCFFFFSINRWNLC